MQTTPRRHDSPRPSEGATYSDRLPAAADRDYAEADQLLAGLRAELAPAQYDRVEALYFALEAGSAARMMAEMDGYEGAIVAHLANVPALWRLLDAHVRDGGYPPEICPVCQRLGREPR
jgi:hypothetical protein